jgi:hypothetical protein
METGFSLYLSHMLLRSRTHPDMLWRIRSPLLCPLSYGRIRLIYAEFSPPGSSRIPRWQHSSQKARSERIVHSVGKPTVHPPDNVGVGIEGDVYAGAPWVFACHEEYCSAGVAEVVQPDGGGPALPRSSLKWRPRRLVPLMVVGKTSLLSCQREPIPSLSSFWRARWRLVRAFFASWLRIVYRLHNYAKDELVAAAGLSLAMDKQLSGSGSTREHCPQAHGARVAAIGQSFGPASVASPQLPGIQP